MEEALSQYADLMKDRRIKKCLLTRTVGKLKTVVSHGADAQADSVEIARSHARQFIDENDNLNIKMKHILLENDIAFENDNEGKPVSTERLLDIEMNVAELSARESEVDKLHGEWMRTYNECEKHTRTVNTDTNAMLAAKTLETFNVIADKLKNHPTLSILPTGMSPPKWDGQNKNFSSWQCRFVKYLQSTVQHLQCITDDTKATFYWDVAGVKQTTDYVCTDTEMEEVKCLKCARTREIDDVYQYVCHSGTIPAQRTRSKCTLVPQNVSIVPMATTSAVYIKQDTHALRTECTHCANDYRTTKMSQLPTTESTQGLPHPTVTNDTMYPVYAPIDNEQLHNNGNKRNCECPSRTSEKGVDDTIEPDGHYCHVVTRLVTAGNNRRNRDQVCMGRLSDSSDVDSIILNCIHLYVNYIRSIV